MEGMSVSTRNLYRRPMVGPFLQARTYVVMFVLLYVTVWVLALALKF